MSDDAIKAALKEALKEWLDEKFAAFGKWSAMGVFAMLLGVGAYLALRAGGWTPPSP